MIKDTTVDPREVAFYENLAAFWWDTSGPFWPLHRLNELRVAWIRDGLCRHFGLASEAREPLNGLRALDIGCGTCHDPAKAFTDSPLKVSEGIEKKTGTRNAPAVVHSAYFSTQHLDGFAHWMRVQAQEELGHAMKLFDYLNERGGTVQLAALDAREVPSRKIGELVMRELQALDHVAYIRFASVYLSFEDIAAFQELIKRLEAEPTPEMQRRQASLIDELED